MTGVAPHKYAALIYGAVRASGQSRHVAMVRAGRVLRREVWCRMVGHDWSWPLAEMLGTDDRPICERCLTAQPREEADRARA